MNDVKALAARQAAYVFDRKTGKIFNAACFSDCLARIAGLNTAIDGRLVDAMLCGRPDVRILSGGAHYELIDPGKG